MVTFASAKLRHEGLAEINDIANDVNALFQRMRDARRMDGMAMQRKFHEEKTAREKAEAEVAMLRAAMQATQSQTDLLRAEYERINKYRHLIPLEKEGDFSPDDEEDDANLDPDAPI